jgi:hypothetical protein
MKVLSWFLIMFTAYGVVLILGHERMVVDLSSRMVRVDNFNYLKNIYISLLPIFPFYVFTRRGMITDQTFRRWLLVFLLTATWSFFDLQNKYLLMALKAGIKREEITNNMGYLFMSLLPMTVFLRKRPFVMFMVLVYCMMFLVMGMKRGAIIIGAVTLVILAFRMMGGFSRFINKKYLILACVLILSGYLIVSYYMENSEYFNYRLEQTLEGESSGRDELFSTFVNHIIYKTGPWHFFVGSGALATLKIANQYAHNDWLELAINQGVLGLLVYILYWLAAYKEWKSSDRNQLYSLAMMLVFFDYFLKSFFSMSYSNMEIFATMTLGYCLAKNQMIKNIRQKKIEDELTRNICNHVTDKKLHSAS